MNESKLRARYTLEFKLEAVKLAKAGQVAAVTAKILRHVINLKACSSLNPGQSVLFQDNDQKIRTSR